MNSYDTASGLYSNVASSSSTLASGVNIIDTSDDSYVTPSLVNAAHQVMMSDGAHIDYPYVILPKTKQDPLHFHISISLRGRKRTIKCGAMVDLEATSMFISHKFVARQRMLKEPLPRKIILYNIDGTINKAGTIEDKVSLYLHIGDQERKWDFLVTNLGPEDVILRLPWLRHVNPAIDWSSGEMTIPSEFLNATSSEEEAKPESSVFCIAANHMQRRSLLKDKVINRADDEIWCCAGFMYSQAITMKDLSKKAEKSFEELVPPRYMS